MFRVNPAPPANPAKTEPGLRLLTVGLGLELTEMVTSFEVPPSGEGLNTVTAFVPTESISLLGIVAKQLTSCTQIVDVRLSEPFQRTFEPLTKLEPYKFRVKAGTASRRLGRIKESYGGLGIGGNEK